MILTKTKTKTSKTTIAKQRDQETQGQDIHSESPSPGSNSRRLSGASSPGSEQSVNELAKGVPSLTNFYEADGCPGLC